jgi:hypothetical protein
MVMPAMVYMVYKADHREAVAHFRAVATATDLPWMLYNNPVAYPVGITPTSSPTWPTSRRWSPSRRARQTPGG